MDALHQQHIEVCASRRPAGPMLQPTFGAPGHDRAYESIMSDFCTLMSFGGSQNTLRRFCRRGIKVARARLRAFWVLEVCNVVRMVPA